MTEALLVICGMVIVLQLAAIGVLWVLVRAMSRSYTVGANLVIEQVLTKLGKQAMEAGQDRVAHDLFILAAHYGGLGREQSRAALR